MFTPGDKIILLSALALDESETKKLLKESSSLVLRKVAEDRLRHLAELGCRRLRPRDD